MELENIANKALELGKSYGASQAEVFVAESKVKSVYVDNNIPKVVDSKIETGIGVKIIIGKKIGFASGTISLEKPNFEEIVQDAIKIAKVSKENPNFESLPAPKKASGTVEAYDTDTANVDLDKLIELTSEIMKAAEDPRVQIPLGVIRAGSITSYVANDLGVNTQQEGTAVFLYFTATAQEGSQKGEGVRRRFAGRLKDINFQMIGRQLKERALSTLEAKAFNEKMDNVVALIDTEEMSQFISQILSTAASAEMINIKASPWIGKIDQRVMSDKITIFDDGRFPWGIRTALYDDEGVPTSKTRIIDKGILKSYYSDSYNASILGEESTGNGFRRGIRDIQGSFAHTVRPAFSTMVLETENLSLYDAIGKIDKGVYIRHFAAPEVNPLSGSFACEIRDGLLIEDGEIVRSIKHALLIGNMYESLNDENLIITNHAEYANGVYIPTLGLGKVSVVGQE